MFVDAVADQSLVIQGYLNSVACTKSFLHYTFPPDQGQHQFHKETCKSDSQPVFVSKMSICVNLFLFKVTVEILLLQLKKKKKTSRNHTRRLPSTKPSFGWKTGEAETCQSELEHWSGLASHQLPNSCYLLKWKTCLGNIKKAAGDAQAHFEQYGIKEEQQTPRSKKHTWKRTQLFLLGPAHLPSLQPAPLPFFLGKHTTPCSSPRQDQMRHHHSIQSYRQWWLKTPKSSLSCRSTRDVCPWEV